jgi:hypothetical protein
MLVLVLLLYLVCKGIKKENKRDSQRDRIRKINLLTIQARGLLAPYCFIAFHLD